MITDSQIKSAMKAVSDEITLRDKAEGKGAGSLLLVVRRLADKTVSAQWFAMAKRDGKRSKRALGRYPDVSLSMARQMMRTEISPGLRAGKTLDRAAGVGKPTLEKMLQAFVDDMKAKGKASAGEVERMLLKADGCAAAVIGRDKLASSVTVEDAIGWIRTYFRAGHRGAADKARAYLSVAFGWATKSANDYTTDKGADWGVTVNPVAAIPKDAGARRTRERNLAAGELAALWVGADPKGDGWSFETALCVRLMIATGQRVQETLRVDGSEVDLDAAMWNMPKHKTKGGKRPHSLPLPALAVDVLRELKEVHGDGPLFPSRTGSKTERVKYSSINHAVARWLKREDVTVNPFQPRDLRRTWKSRTGDLGIDRFTRDLIQQHAQSDTGSKHYDRASYLPQMRQAMTAWNDWLSNELERFKKSIGTMAKAA